MPNELKTADGHTVPEKWSEDADYRPDKYSLSNGEIAATGTLCAGAITNISRELLEKRKQLAAANAQIQELQQGRCGMCNESPSNPVHGSGEGQHAFVTGADEELVQDAAAAHQAQRYAALEKRLEEMDAALREARSFIVVVECEEGLTTENLIAQIDAALVSEDGL